jgi:Tol biopolymer transport system component
MKSVRRRYIFIAGTTLLALALLFLLLLVRQWVIWPQPSGILVIPVHLAGRAQLYRIDVPSGRMDTVPLDHPGVGSAHHTVLSPDGKWLAFAAGDEEVNRRIYITALDGSHSLPLTVGPLDSEPQWSADSTQIVFSRWISPHSALFRVDVGTGVEVPLTGFANELEPDWSPDGQTIVFTTSRDGFQELYTMSPDGSDLRRLTENEGLNDLQGVYSPNGSMIAYITNTAVGNNSGEIWLMNADGSNQRRLTNNDRYDQLPVWSPNSAHIAFTSTRTDDGPNRDIFVYDLVGDTLRQLTQSPGSSFSPYWSPDSQWIAFAFSNGSVSPDLYLMRADGSDARLLLPEFGSRILDGLVWLP